MFAVRQPIRRAWIARLLPLIPLALIVAFYGWTAHERHLRNPGDKMMPVAGQIREAVVFSFTAEEFSGKVPIVEDTISSLKLFSMGLGLAVAVSLFLGLHLGAWSWANAMFDPTLKVLSYLPPVALIPLIFLFLGFETAAKVFIIFIATMLPLTRSLVLRVQQIPDKQIWNVQTLGPTPFEMIWLVIRRHVEPEFLDDVRLNLGTAWVYLIVAELIASNAGLGYRINVASRNMDVAQILFYLAVIALLAFLMDRTIHRFNRWKNRWYFLGPGGESK
ncbi:MAG: ABC transporter permease subunit [Verrucomicrobia bacterium]|nr:ABC transporter permease subunit [Verrucomicrobiota bacterium]